LLAVVLVNFHGIADTLECLRSLESARDAMRVIVVDNASGNDEARRLAEAFPWITLLESQHNLGWSGGNNLGIREALKPCDPSTASSDIVLLLNNDTVVDPSILAEIRTAIEQGWDVVGPIINEYSDQSRIQTEGVRFNRIGGSGFFESIQVSEVSSGIASTDIVNGCAVAIHKKVFDQIGMIDDRYFLICEESDFCLRAQKAGFKLGIIPKSLVWHKHSVSFQRAGKPLQRYYGTRNLFLLLTKHWGGTGRRGLFGSMYAYLKNVYHIHCHELEVANREGAEAIMIGLSDGILGRFGPRRIEMNWFAACLSQVFFLAWKLRGGKVGHTTPGST
jgi:GT2 family glycosyltransferase